VVQILGGPAEPMYRINDERVDGKAQLVDCRRVNITMQADV
jgi:hypothetical protein